jgi:hypothetical protein
VIVACLEYLDLLRRLFRFEISTGNPEQPSPLPLNPHARRADPKAGTAEARGKYPLTLRHTTVVKKYRFTPAYPMVTSARSVR